MHRLKGKPKPLPAHILYSETWEEFKVGDEVRVKGEHDGGRYVVRGFVTNSNRDIVWADLWGGTTGQKMWRSVAPDRLVKVRKRDTGNSRDRK